MSNINLSVSVMNRVANRGGILDMTRWQEPHPANEDEEIYKTELEVHDCGSAACFGGWLAVSDEWKKSGGTMDATGGPLLRLNELDLFGSDALAVWLDISNKDAELLSCSGMNYGDRSHYYGKDVRSITAQDVVKKLKYLRRRQIRLQKRA